MAKKTDSKNVNLIRLTALWAISEAALGGVLHMFRLPFTGLIVGSVAVILISMIAYFSDKPFQAITRATITVLIIKLFVSPHSPIPAYLAVSFQGLAGAVFFSLLPSFRIGSLLLGILALLQSAIQKLITLTLIFGKPLWSSIDAFIAYVLKIFGTDISAVPNNGSYWLVGTYLTIYATVGLVIGILAGKIPSLVAKEITQLTPLQVSIENTSAEKNRSVRKPFWKKRKWKFLVGILVLLISLQFLLPKEQQTLEIFSYLVRVIAILACWFMIVAPLLLKVMHMFLNKQKSKYTEDVDQALALAPAIKSITAHVWKMNQNTNWTNKWKQVIIQIISYTLIYKKPDGL